MYHFLNVRACEHGVYFPFTTKCEHYLSAIRASEWRLFGAHNANSKGNLRTKTVKPCYKMSDIYFLNVRACSPPKCASLCTPE